MPTEQTDAAPLYDWKSFFYLSVDLLCVADFDGYFKHLNPAWERTLGWSIDELLARPWLDFVHPDDRRETIEAGERLHQGHLVIAFTNRYRCKDGSFRSLHWNAAPRCRTQTIDAVVRDITGDLHWQQELEKRVQERTEALVAANAAAKASDARFHAAMEGSPDAFAILDSVRDERGTIVDFRFAELNSTAASRVSEKPSDLIGKRITEIFSGGQALPYVELLARVVESREASEHEARVVFPDADLTWVHRLVVPMGDGVAVTGKDISQRKREEDELRESEERLRHLEDQLRQAQKMEAVGRLAGGVAHDFNNLLSVILTYSELMLADLEKGEPMRGQIEDIHEAGKRAAELTRQLLLFSRQQPVELKTVDLNEVLARADKMLRRIVGEDVELRSVPGAELGPVRADTGLIEQVLMNMVVNARDAMPRGGKLTIETANVVLDERFGQEHVGVKQGPHVMLAVTDTGTGMSRATQERIFEPFFTTKETGKGTGLGLSTVFGIVHRCGGFIDVDSELGRGTTFRVYLPLSEGAVEEAAAALSQSSPRGTETVLLVEDEDQVRAVARSILRRAGYRVVEARGPGEALLLSEQLAEPIHLLLSDVVMPQLSGPELARRLSAMRPEMKVLCMSGYTDDAAVRHGVVDAKFAYLQKPITVETLTRKVREVLDSKRHATQRAAE